MASLEGHRQESGDSPPRCLIFRLNEDGVGPEILKDVSNDSDYKLIIYGINLN